jgi:hypothetical protein
MYLTKLPIQRLTLHDKGADASHFPRVENGHTGRQTMESKMTRSESVDVAIEDIEDVEFIEVIEPGSLEYFRLHSPLPLLLQAFFENPQNRMNLCRYESETAKSACKNNTDFWRMLITAEELAELFELYSGDPNAKALVARLRALTGCDGRLNYTG